MSLVFMGESRSWVANDLHANILLPLIVARSGSFKEQRRSKRGYSYQYSSSFMVTRFGSFKESGRLRREDFHTNILVLWSQDLIPLRSKEDQSERIFIFYYGDKIWFIKEFGRLRRENFHTNTLLLWLQDLVRLKNWKYKQDFLSKILLLW